MGQGRRPVGGRQGRDRRVLDTGIWPESRSFAGKRTIRRPHARPVHGIRARWTGRCETGERFVRRDCNRKLIGARYFVEGFGEENVDESDYISRVTATATALHTASTAAGNRVRRVVVDGTRFGTVSGMAPAAKVAAYKVCWTGSVEREVDDGCILSDSVAAIDQAVIDGVDVINYSIGSASSESTVIDPVEMAFMFAAAAGVYNAASAGNSGPGESTLDHPSPWVSTTAAGTHRIAEKKLVLGNGREFIGASTTSALPNLTPMVMAEDSGKAASTPPKPRSVGRGPWILPRCRASWSSAFEAWWTGSRSPSRSGGRRRRHGADQPVAELLNGDLHAVPSVHLADTALAPVNAYVDGPSPVGKIVSLAKGESQTQVPEVAEFSSRGPSTTTGGDILKPDLAAPGVDVLAAVAPPFHHGRRYDLISVPRCPRPQRRARRRDPAGAPAMDADGGEVCLDDHGQESRVDERPQGWGLRPGCRLRPADLRARSGHRVPPRIPPGSATSRKWRTRTSTASSTAASAGPAAVSSTRPRSRSDGWQAQRPSREP